MIGELSVLSEWIPEQMEPGTLFVVKRWRGWRKRGSSPGSFCLVQPAERSAALLANRSRKYCLRFADRSRRSSLSKTIATKSFRVSGG